MNHCEMLINSFFNFAKKPYPYNMKNIYATLLLSIMALSSFAQLTTESWDFDGLNREYRQYVPSIYDGSEPVPLIISLHGLGDNMGNFSQVGFHQVADTANVIVVTPQAILDAVLSGATAWNSGAGLLGISLNGDVEDIGFINALIDTVSEHYNIDQNRVYATGFSMGGFMSNRLACELNDRIAAIASVAGTVGGTLTCTPGQEVPVCHFHGTADTQVGYGTAGGGVQDNTFGNNVTDWISFWNNNNGCGTITLEGQFPNTAGDDRSVEYVEYAGCTGGSRVVHYKVNNAEHDWLFTPTNDIFYTVEIWKFFLGLSPTNLVPASINEASIGTIGIYPNPATDVLRLENVDADILNISIFSTTGQLVLEQGSNVNTLDVAGLEKGVYQIMVATKDGLYLNSFVKN